MSGREPASPESALAHHLTRLGEVGEVYGIDLTGAQTWVGGMDAARISGVQMRTLRAWADAGVITFSRNSPTGNRRYLREEMVILAGVETLGRPVNRGDLGAHLALRRRGRADEEKSEVTR